MPAYLLDWQALILLTSGIRVAAFDALLVPHQPAFDFPCDGLRASAQDRSSHPTITSPMTHHCELALDKARQLIGYEPHTPFEEGLQHTIEWFRNHWKEIEASARFGPGVSAAVREMAVVEE